MRNSARTYAASALITLLAACRSVPTPATPDGRNRTPVNDQASIDQYTARVARAAARVSDDGATLREIESIKRDVASLKRSLAERVVEADGAPPRAAQAGPGGGAFAAGAKANQAGATGSRETLELRQQSLVFRITHGVADSAFLPSPPLREELVRAARAARRIEIRGRSDSALASAANGRIALARAQKARQFLLKHGIAAGKIRMRYLAAGDFIADNATDAGRARNRRVEIEAIGLPTESFKKFADTSEGAMP